MSSPTSPLVDVLSWSRTWRLPSGATEDRNAVGLRLGGTGRDLAVALRGDRGSQLGCPHGTKWPQQVAVALRGDRGSQRLTGEPRGRSDPRWRLPSGATEDRNAQPRQGQRGGAHRGGGCPPGRPRIATFHANRARSTCHRGGCPPGRPRIATAAPRPSRPGPERWRLPSGATEDRNLRKINGRAVALMVAVALRGDRGSQHRGRGDRRVSIERWRLPSGATEDRNAGPKLNACTLPAVAVALRGDRGSQPRGPRNDSPRHARWRLPSGATEDRNGASDALWSWWVGQVAVALRGDRGSQPLAVRW